MAHDLEKKWRSKDVMLLENADFASMLLCDRVLSGLSNAGFKTPSPIQLEAIPTGRFGKDLLVQAKSGTGKTLVFVIVALEMLHRKLFRPQVLILVPTREIATQICSVVKIVGSSFPKLTCESFIGGLSVADDVKKVHNCQVVIGTPGRIRQLVSLKALSTTSVRLLVLDEADELLKYLWQDDIECIFNSLPEDKQVIATSATYPSKLKKNLFKFLRDPYLARLDLRKLALLGIVHYAKIVECSSMPIKLYKFKLAALEPILKNIKFTQCLVYCNGLHKVETLYRDIKKWGFSTTYISSNKQQVDRLKAIDCLKRFKCKVLVSSDVTARGIDAENVDLVINFDISSCAETYLHRSGRAGRYGTVGATISIVDSYELNILRKIEKEANFKSYQLPDPIPVDLIQNPSLEKCAFEVSEEEIEEKSDVSVKKENGFFNGEKHAMEKDNVGKVKTSLELVQSIKNQNVDDCLQGADLSSQCESNEFDSSLYRNDMKYAVESEEEIEKKSEVSIKKKNGSFNGKKHAIEEDNVEKVRTSSELVQSIKNQNVDDCLQGAHLNSECESKEFDSSLYRNDAKYAVEISQGDESEEEIIKKSDVSIKKKNGFSYGDKHVTEKGNVEEVRASSELVQSIKSQNVDDCHQSADLSSQCESNEFDSSLSRNDVSHAIATFIQKYETNKTVESLLSENVSVLTDMESSETDNPEKKRISACNVIDLNLRRSDYYYKILKLFQEDNAYNNIESKTQENLNEIEPIPLENEPCVGEKMLSTEITGEEKLPISEITEEPIFIKASELVNSAEFESTVVDNPLLENASVPDYDDIPNFFEIPGHESTPLYDKSKYKITTLFDTSALEQPKKKSIAFFDKISSSGTDSEKSVSEAYSSELDGKGILDASQCSSEDSESRSDTSDSSSAEDDKSEGYNESFLDKVSHNGSQESSVDSSSVHSVMYKSTKAKNFKKHVHSATELSSSLKTNQQAQYSSYVNAYQYPHYSNDVNAYQQPLHYSYSNAYQQLHSSCSNACKQPRHSVNFHTYSNPLQSSRFSNKRHYPQHSIIGLDCKQHVSTEKCNFVNRNADRAKYLPGHSSSSGQHSLTCFMPSEHRCHTYNDSNFCNQRSACAQWYQVFYNQWLHIQRCCNFTS